MAAWLGSQTGSQRVTLGAMTQATSKRRGHGDDSIYWDESKNRYVGAISLGWSADGERRIRKKVSGRTKAEVRDKLRELRNALDGGIRPSARYTVQQAVDDWLEYGLDGRSPKTLSTIREVLAPVTEQIGKVKLRGLTAADVRMALAEA